MALRVFSGLQTPSVPLCFDARSNRLPSSLSLKDKIGQLLVTGFDGTTLNDQTRSLILDHGIGGFILFERNYESPQQLRALTTEMQKLALSRPPHRPLWISVDQEGGRVCRLKAPFSALPFQSRLGKADSKELAFQYGKALGDELRVVGINLDYAPVLDANTNPANPIIGERAISADPELAGRLGSAVIRGFYASGVLPVGKHFPGHGDTELDSHLALPIVHKDAASLERQELVPFAHAFQEDLPMLMTAHVVYPAWDETHPATFSKFIMRDLLRGRMGYQGLVISDDLEMKAVADHYPLDSMPELGLTAGIDLFLVCHSIEKTLNLKEGLIRAGEWGGMLAARIEESAQRVERIKQRLPDPLSLPADEVADLARNHQTLIAQLASYS